MLTKCGSDDTPPAKEGEASIDTNSTKHNESPDDIIVELDSDEEREMTKAAEDARRRRGRSGGRRQVEGEVTREDEKDLHGK